MAKLPTDAELTVLVHLGLSDPEIAERYGVSKQAVQKRRDKMGLVKINPAQERVNTALKSIWDVKTDRTGEDTHHNRYFLKCVKVYMRMRLGDKISGYQKEEVARFLSQLEREKSVVHYRRKVEGEQGEETADEALEGFVLVLREPSDGRRILRWPADVELPEEDLQRAMELPDEE
ncbi:hypothetical protein AF335_33105 [Streptomyces eurocidicus]|uniref:Uncharacterized protein n=1 Tax=Streptomyces eurocidicus TaxID=66423 RepID=A0A2N8NLZ6_STREU|nr:hypothetical protein [Streptomyces eurocidicus]MBB5123210.1 hypothetical protein [Streptomyces eurocidicus]MBF6055487.1 hypothetical protein [Streptomyces eurocidicus]PNE29789.1 hypothetical protein AF335_33105 [Streptomyces eurocidicus]